MYDFLSFNSFITQNVLIVFYYIGVFIMPVVLYFFFDKLKEILHVKYMTNHKKVIILSVVLLLFAELFWRMGFEVMIGYFDMHDYLRLLSKDR